MRVAPMVMPITTTVTEVHVRVRPWRVINRRLIHHHRRRRRHINHTRRAHRYGRRAIHWCGGRTIRRRWRITGIRHRITCRLAVNRVGDEDPGGDSRQNFSNRCPFAVSRTSACDVCSCNCQKRNGCDDFFHNWPFVVNRVFQLQTV